MHARLATALLLVTMVSLPASAQQNESDQPEGPAMPAPQRAAGEPALAVLMGTFVDETDSRPLPAVPVEIRDAGTSLVAGALTDAAGRFRVEGLAPGQYSLRATTLGYAPVQLDSIALEPGAVRRLDPVRLRVSAVELKGLSVTSERAEVRLEVDRTVFNARNAPSAAGGNATDVLRNVPSVDVDPEGQVSVRGSSDIVIQINGRTAPFKGDALAMYLKQLPASTIEQVEVFANPAAKYDPEGMAGIVNIVLRENTDLGLSAAITVAGSSSDRYNGSGAVGFQQGRLNLAGMYAVNSDLRRPSGTMERLNFLGAAAGETIFQDSRSLRESLSHSFTGSMDVRIRPKTTLSLQASGSTNGNESLTVNDFQLLAGEELLVREWINATDTNRDLRSGDLVFGLKHAPARTDEVAFEARLSGTSDASDARYGDELLTDLRELTSTETSTRDASLQLDVTRTVAGFRLETGARAEQRLIGTDFSREPFGTSGLAPDQNAFDYDTRIYAGYAQASRGVGPVTLQAGLRAEHADTRFDLLAESDSYDNRYNSLYPSASAVMELGERRSVRLGYSRRVRRPRTQQLNPFALQTDSLSLRVGNPSLKPQYTSSFDLTLQTGGALGTLQVTPFYRVTADLIQYFKTVDPGTGISTTTFRNFDRSSQFGLDVTATGRLGSRVRGMLGTNLAQISTDAENLEAGLRSSALSWSVRSSASLRLAESTDLQGFVMYRAPRDIAQGWMRSFMVSNISLRHRLLDGKGDVVLRMSDPFGKMNFGFYTSDEFHEQDFLRRIDARKLTLSFSYSFGKPPRMRQAASEEVDMGIR
jgi:outer membrane receptor protein involved in Fe transport